MYIFIGIVNAVLFFVMLALAAFWYLEGNYKWAIMYFVFGIINGLIAGLFLLN